MNVVSITRTTVERHFDGPDDVLAYVAKPSVTIPGADLHSRSNPDDWAGGSYADAMRLARDGWLEKVSAVDTSGLTSQGAPTWETRHDVSGAWVDIDRYLTGEPENMIEPYVSDAKPITRIAVNLFIPAMLEVEKALEQTRAIVGLVDDLTREGHATEVVAYLSTQMNGGHALYVIPLKRASEPIDLASFAFWLGHPTCFRRIMFAVEELEPETVRRAIGADGTSYGLVDNSIPTTIEADLYIPELRYATRYLGAWTAKRRGEQEG